MTGRAKVGQTPGVAELREPLTHPAAAQTQQPFLCPPQGPPGDIGFKGIQGPRGPPGLMVSALPVCPSRDSRLAISAPSVLSPLCPCSSLRVQSCRPAPFLLLPSPTQSPPPPGAQDAGDAWSGPAGGGLPSTPLGHSAALYPPGPVTLSPRSGDKDTQAFLSPLGKGRHHWAPRNPGTFRTPGTRRGLARSTAGQGGP